MIQDVATQNANFLIEDQELSSEDSPKKNEFGGDCFRYALRAIKSDQLILGAGALKFERINSGPGHQCDVSAPIYSIGISDCVLPVCGWRSFA